MDQIDTVDMIVIGMVAVGGGTEEEVVVAGTVGGRGATVEVDHPPPSIGGDRIAGVCLGLHHGTDPADKRGELLEYWSQKKRDKQKNVLFIWCITIV